MNWFNIFVHFFSDAQAPNCLSLWSFTHVNELLLMGCILVLQLVHFTISGLDKGRLAHIRIIELNFK